MNDARRVALDVLDAVFGPKPRPAEEVFHDHPLLPRLEARDRAFARLLYATTLRRLGEIDRILSAHVRRVPRRSVRNILRLATVQVVFLGTPAHAAVSESVALARQVAPALAGFVNAVARRVAAADHRPLPEEEAARIDTPQWLFRRWAQAYGEELALRIARVHLREPPLDLQVRADPEAWAAKLGAELLPDGTLRRHEAGPVEALPGYREGAFWVQDVAAALPVRLLGDFAGREVIELCAAPGGKTAQLCAAGARVTAVEVSSRRARLLRRNLERLGFEAQIVEADARHWRPPAPAPFVLLDAPCTATGTIRRHPDIARIRRPEDVGRLAALQSELLEAAASMLASGGVLVYAVCSLEPEEGPDRSAALLARQPGVERVPVEPAELRGLPVPITPAGEVRTLPCHLEERGGMDGFHVARLRRSDRT